VELSAVGGYKDGKRLDASNLPSSILPAHCPRRFLAYVTSLVRHIRIHHRYWLWIVHRSTLLRKAVEGREDTLTEREAQAILEESLLVLFYRDARSLDKASPKNLDCCCLAYPPAVPNRQGHR